MATGPFHYDEDEDAVMDMDDTNSDSVPTEAPPAEVRQWSPPGWYCQKEALQVQKTYDLPPGSAQPLHFWGKEGGRVQELVNGVVIFTPFNAGPSGSALFQDGSAPYQDGSAPYHEGSVPYHEGSAPYQDGSAPMVDWIYPQWYFVPYLMPAETIIDNRVAPSTLNATQEVQGSIIVVSALEEDLPQPEQIGDTVTVAERDSMALQGTLAEQNPTATVGNSPLCYIAHDTSALIPEHEASYVAQENAASELGAKDEKAPESPAAQPNACKWADYEDAAEGEAAAEPVVVAFPRAAAEDEAVTQAVVVALSPTADGKTQIHLEGKPKGRRGCRAGAKVRGKREEAEAARHKAAEDGEVQRLQSRRLTLRREAEQARQACAALASRGARQTWVTDKSASRNEAAVFKNLVPCSTISLSATAASSGKAANAPKERRPERSIAPWAEVALCGSSTDMTPLEEVAAPKPVLGQIIWPTLGRRSH